MEEHEAEHEAAIDIADTLLEVFAAEDAIDAKTKELVAWMRTVTGLAFIDSLVEQYDAKGWLSEKQIETAERIRRDRTPTHRRPAVTKPKAAAPVKTKTPPVVSTKAGFYRTERGYLFRVMSTEQTFKSDGAPDEFGDLMRWYGVGIENLPSEAVRLSLDNVVGFGLIYGTCIVCGEGISDDNNEGIHASCAFRLPTMYGYIPEPDVSTE